MSLLVDLIAHHRDTMDEAAARVLYGKQSQDYRAVVEEEAFVDFFTSRNRQLLFAHDYEASDSHAQTAAPLQIAGVYTDVCFRPLDMPVNLYCQLHGDKLPSPMAIEITQIAPSFVADKGLPEPAFFKKICHLMSVANTCSYGYNSIKYDDTVTRFGFYRNLLPPYTREYELGNSRWDAMHVTLAYYYHYKDDSQIVWPTKEDGKPSFQLERLCAANNITQQNAHNAVDDVAAMVGWMAKLRRLDPALMDYCYKRRKKAAIKGVIYPGAKVYLPSLFAGQEKDYCYHLLVLGVVPGDRNKYFGVDVRDIEKLRACFKLDNDEIRRRMYLKQEECEAEGVERPPLVTFAINQAPVIMDETTPVKGGHMEPISAPDWQHKLMAQASFLSRLGSVMAFDPQSQASAGSNIETGLYDGFPSEYDSALQSRVKNTALPEAYAGLPEFQSEAFNVLRARAVDKLSSSLTPQWALHRRQAREAQLKAWYPDINDYWSAYWNDVDTIITSQALRDDIKQTVKKWFEEEDAVSHGDTKSDAG